MTSYLPLRSPDDSLRDDPLGGRYGLHWYERKPRSLSPDEWRALDHALRDGRISPADYVDWKENVR